MNQQPAGLVKIFCAFIFHIDDPLATLKNIAMFFHERYIVVDTLNMHRCQNGDTVLILHCKVEKDQLHDMTDLLEQIKGITEMEWIAAK